MEITCNSQRTMLLGFDVRGRVAWSVVSAGALGVGLLASGDALAQNASPISHGSHIQQVDQNFVDLSTGNVVLPDMVTISAGTDGKASGYVTQPDLASVSAGIDGDDGIKFSGVSQSDRDENLVISQPPVSYGSGGPIIANFIDIAISAGNSTAHYTCTISSTPACAPDIPDGQSLSYDSASNSWTYINKTGEVHTFTDVEGGYAPYNNGYPGSYPTTANLNNTVFGTWVLNKVVAPDGTAQKFYYQMSPCEIATQYMTFSYAFVRKTAIVKSTGYMLKFSYQSDSLSQATGPEDWIINGSGAWSKYKSVKLYNMALAYCSTDSSPCSAQPLSYLNFSVTKPNSLSEIRTITDPNGSMWTLTYKVIPHTDQVNSVSTFKPLSLRYPGEATDRFAYTYIDDLVDAPVSSATTGGKTWLYNYKNFLGSSPNAVPTELSVVDPLGNITSVKRDYTVTYGPFLSGNRVSIQGSLNGTGWPISVTDPLSRSYLNTFVEVFPILHRSMVKTAKYPEGNYRQYDYDNRGNIIKTTEVPKPGSLLPTIVSLSQFSTSCSNPKICNKPSSVTDSRGGVTDLTYDSVHGGVLSVMGPPASSGAARPLRLFTYVQKSAYILNASGALVASGMPKWLPDTLTTCQGVAGGNAAACDVNAPIATVKYLYGVDGTADNLKLHGRETTANGVTLRTCFKFDALGRIVGETAPNANLGGCP